LDSWDTEIACATSHALRSFAKDELAYLALTSKIEDPIRDRMAFHLHTKHAVDGYLTAREWERVDIAVISPDAKPACLVELKAIYTFDALERRPWFVGPVDSDLKKISQYKAPTENIFAVVLSTHVHGTVPPQYREVVKHSALIDRAYRKDSKSQSIRDRASEALSYLYGDRIRFQGDHSAGSAFGLEVTMHWCLVRPAT
jgi:hypothetical protein